MGKKKYTNTTLSFDSTLLLFSLIFLKLTGYAQMSWYVALSPFWLPVSILFGLLIVIVVLLMIAALLDKLFKTKMADTFTHYVNSGCAKFNGWYESLTGRKIK